MIEGIPEIPDDVLRIAYSDAERCYPEEACGLFIGARGATRCDEARLCKNQQNALHARDPATYSRDARTAYALDVNDVRYIDDSQRSERPVQIIYHSHVDVGAYFSAEDQRAALMWDEPIFPVDYLVIDCQKSGAQGAVLFRFRDGAFVAIRQFSALTAAPPGTQGTP